MAQLLFHKLDHEVCGFSCGNGSIERQIREAYLSCLIEFTYTFEITTSDGRVLGYFGLRMREIKLETLPEDIRELDLGYDFCFYAVEIKFLAVRKEYQKHRIGTSTLGAIIKILQEYHENLPFRFIYIDALQELVSWYQKVGFIPFEGNGLNDVVMPMYYDLCKNRTKISEYFEE